MQQHRSYPLPAYLKFCPGGITYHGAAAEDFYRLSEYTGASKSNTRSGRSTPTSPLQSPRPLLPDVLLSKAKQADIRLRQYALLADPSGTTPLFLPSLSVLAEQCFGRLTGCPGIAAKGWADAMILHYFESSLDDAAVTCEEDIYSSKPMAIQPLTDTNTAAGLLRKLHEEAQSTQASDSAVGRPRPCGYVFKRGDIAWNCRTCQTDATCVICDSCFRHSDHQGHEVYFHRTSPGGCCDCGDPEAWKSEGCCDKHRPLATKIGAERPSTELDPMEAVTMALKGLKDGIDTVSSHPATKLPPRLAAALGVVIGAAVGAILEAVDGAAIGADPVQWKRRWAHEAACIFNGMSNNEQYFLAGNYELATPATFSVDPAQRLPESFDVHLRLHNDDVHTFDEVIEALHGDPRMRRHMDDPANILVPARESATEMTHHVDADGQVTVKVYSSIIEAMVGFKRLKASGLHCAVVSNAQVQTELRARVLIAWLSEICAAHPAAAALVVHALVQVDPFHDLGGVQVWSTARMIPPWAALDQMDEPMRCRRRFHAFPPHLMSSYLTREECELIHGIALEINATSFVGLTGTDPGFYAKVPYRLPSERYRKSPHSLWGTLPSNYSDPVSLDAKHPLLRRLVTGQFDTATISLPNKLTETVFVVDTDLRKQQNPKILTSSLYTHKLPGLHMISGIGTMRTSEISERRPPLPYPMHLRHLLGISSFRAPVSPILLVLLFDPYPTKQLRGSLHVLFLSLLTDSRFKSRFAGALGVAYRPLSTLFCAGVGTEADSPLHFSVQIFTAGSLVRALSHRNAAEKLLLSDHFIEGLVTEDTNHNESSIGVFVPPISHVIVRCIHTNLLGATQEVSMILKNTTSGTDDNSIDEPVQLGNDNLLPALTYVAGEHPLLTPLPAAHDDGFLDSRSTRHKRLPHILRDLEYVIETPGTALRLLLPHRFPTYHGPSLSLRGEDILPFASIFARMLRLAQGMDTQKRKISGGHVEYEQNRWLEAFGLSLNFAGARDALAESSSSSVDPSSDDISHLNAVREAIGNFFAALLCELKLWLYRESLLETGLPVSPSQGIDISQVTSLQRSTLHVSGSEYLDYTDSTPLDGIAHPARPANTVALSCATGIKMTEAQLILIENSLKIAGSQKVPDVHDSSAPHTGPLITDWLRVPHSPLGGDALSFHLPLHRAMAKCIRSICSVVVPPSYRDSFPSTWWQLPVLDDNQVPPVQLDPPSFTHHPLVTVLRSTLRSSNCRVNWSAGPDCTPQDAQRRRARSRAVSVNIAVAKVIHSLVDHPLRCLAAAQQVERHLWTRNGTSVAGMAMNYSNTPLCRSFRDLDLLMVQLSAAGMSCGLGSRRTFSLILSRFSMDGYLCDPERRSAVATTGSSFASQTSTWVNPPRLQDPDHAVILAESFFATICVLVTELPPPPPDTISDNVSLRQSIRRELVHALLAEPRSHSAAMAAASGGISRREESDGNSGSSGGASMFSEAFASVLEEVGIQKTRSSSRAASGPPVFELKAECCDEYDPTYYHLKRQEHQHAMDVVERLRKQKLGKDKSTADSMSLPLVCPPPKAHPRFLPCRLVLHLDLMDAAIRRSLLFALTNGSWLPPSEPTNLGDKHSEKASSDEVDVSVMVAGSPSGADVPMTTFNNRRILHSQASGASFSIARRENETTLFSKEVVAASSVSFLELLQLLTLQIHTLEECASLHRLLSNLDDESRLLSSSLSINSYLGRLIHVPTSLVDVWALRPHPHGPLQSKGSGEKRGSILGLLIALYEHRSDHGAILDSEGGDQTDEGHGGARALASSGLKWILRFVNALVDGAPTVTAAVKSATSGVREIKPQIDLNASSWTIDREVRSVITRMLANLTDLWPIERGKIESSEKTTPKVSEAGKAAQKRQLEKMRRMQARFAATIKGIDDQKNTIDSDTGNDQCIICRCDDVDGENNGPLGYLGHVQRSRVVQMRASTEANWRKGAPLDLSRSYLVVGHRGCQLRETEAMDSRPLACLPKGSVVTLISDKVSMEYGVLSRRVFVRHKPESNINEGVTEGWASIQSSGGYVILSPLHSICYTNSRWGSTRPVIKQCGHAAHLRCVETHTLSLHHRAASEQTYDGRFAANIDDGEFLCPLCKQLCNILIPRDKTIEGDLDKNMDIDGIDQSTKGGLSMMRTALRTGCSIYLTSEERDSMTSKALDQFGSKLYSAMNVPWERATSSQRKHQQQWNQAIQKWDFEEVSKDDGSVKDTLRLLRQQLIAWSAVGHNASALEASTRAMEEVLPFGTFSTTSDPWQGFNVKSRDSHPMLLELRRMLNASSGLLQLLCRYVSDQLSSNDNRGQATIIGECLANILEGRSWVEHVLSKDVNSSEIDGALWSCLYTLISAIPCHVSRDGTIAQRCEARATAAAMWAMKGLGRTQHDESTGVPAPFAIQQLPSSQTCSSGWGTLNPCSISTQTSFAQPFRLGIAGAFPYLPLLSWDLNTLSTAIFSALLGNPVKALPSGQQILSICKTLMLGRIVQAIVTPCGFDLPDGTDLDEESCWHSTEVQNEGEALSTLIAHCRFVIKRKSITHGQKVLGDSSAYQGNAVLAGVGRAILPFSRSFILILRAFVSTVRDRQQRSGHLVERNEFDKILDKVVCSDDLMTVEDGFHLIKAMEGPLPSQVIDPADEWWALINRWLVAALTLEYHHGSRGKTIESLLEGVPASDANDPESREYLLKPQATTTDLMDVNDPSGEAPELAPAYDRNESMDQDDIDVDISEAGQDNFLMLRREMLQDSFDDDDDDDDVMMQDVEEFTGLAGGMPTFTFMNPALNGNTDGGDTSEEYSSSDIEGEDSDREFAYVSKSPILYYQPSLLGIERVGPGKPGETFDSGSASSIMSDLSHLSLVHLKGVPTFSLVKLPKSFVELYNMVNIVKGSGEESSGLDDNDDLANSETAICLLTGAVMRSGSPRRTFARAARQPGSCTIHARKTGSGIGIFFLVQKCTVLLMHNNKSAYSPSLYVDVHGEEDPGLKRGRPLFLQEDRYRALERLWRQQGIPGEVAQIRSTSDRVIRDNWY